MITIEFNIYHSYILSYKKAAKELDMDLIVNIIQGEEWLPAIILVGDYTSFSGFCFCAGIDAMACRIENPMKELMGNIERRISDAEKNNK